MSEQVVMTISQTSDYKFEVDFGAALSPIMADLPPPLGEGSAPSPEHLLLAAVANCLSASLLFALRKFKQNATNIKTTISCTVDRNENKRMRVTQITATINLGKQAAEFENLDRILAQFEEFCTVSQSVQAGIPLQIQVQDSTGAVLK
jgi:uncharacterized OsmC-like protein